MTPGMMPGTLPGARYRTEALLFVLLILLGIWSCSLGASHLPLLRLWSADKAVADLARQIIFDIRLPRGCLAILVGGSLGLAGAVLQGLLRNPLADPAVLGISATASLGAVLCFYFGIQAVAVGGIGGSLAAVALLAILAGRHPTTNTLLLTGVALSSFAVALTALLLNLAPSPFAAFEMMFWLLGSVADRSWVQVAWVLPPMLVGWALLAATTRGLDALALGEDVAQSLGISLSKLRWFVIFGTTLCIGPAVAAAGSIGFVGLVVPHLLRPWVGHSARRLLPASFLGGAVMLLAADIAVRLASGQTELKLGVTTALVGAPFFLRLLWKMRGP